MERRLLFCRTPLQSLIVREIQRIAPADDVIIYQPTSSSEKHKIYFDRMDAPKKVFLRWLPYDVSYTLAELRVYASIPRWVRRVEFDVCLISSFDSLVFSIFHGGRNIPIETFDDGVMHLLPTEMNMRVEKEDAAHFWIKRLAGTLRNAEVLSASRRHYTLYEEQMSFMPREIVSRINLFQTNDERTKRHARVTVFIGAPIILYPGGTAAGVSEIYEHLVASTPFDIFMPHPAEGRPPIIRQDFPGVDLSEGALRQQIAEELLLNLYHCGYDITVIGIASSVLLNACGFAQCINAIIPGINDADRGVFEHFGVKSVAATDLLAAGGARSLL